MIESQNFQKGEFHKQHLRIRSFYARSQNAVRCQIWSAICAYLMVAIVRKAANLRKSLDEILQSISVNILEQHPLSELITEALHQESPPMLNRRTLSFLKINSGHY